MSLLDRDPWACGVEKFNLGKYFEAHEFWEEIWIKASGGEKDYIQSLILACGVLIHIQKENQWAAKKLALNCQKKLTNSQNFKYSIRGLENFLKLVSEESWREAKAKITKLKAYGVRV